MSLNIARIIITSKNIITGENIGCTDTTYKPKHSHYNGSLLDHQHEDKGNVHVHCNKKVYDEQQFVYKHGYIL